MSDQKPRVWPCFAVWVAALWARGAVGAWCRPRPPELDASAEASFGHLAACPTQPAFMLALLVAAQLALLIPRLAARASSVPWRTRLTAGGRTPASGSRCTASPLSAPGPSAGSWSTSRTRPMRRSAGRRAGVPARGVGLRRARLVLPGIIEEHLFRGYIQSRLLQRWPAWVAIGVSSVLFALFHMDPIYVVAVLPQGIWLGALAWRTGGVRGIVRRIFTNLVAFGTLALEPHISGIPAGIEVLAQTVAVGFLVAGVGALRRRAPSRARPSPGCGLRQGPAPARRALPHPLRPAATAGGRSASYGTSSSSPSSPPDQESGDSGIAQASPSPLASIVGT